MEPGLAPSEAKIVCNKCGKNHYPIVCNNVDGVRATKKEEEPKPITPTSTPAVVEKSSNNHNSYSAPVLLQTLAVTAIGKISKIVRVLVDSGSQGSFITERLADELELVPFKKSVVNHTVFGGGKFTQVHSHYNITLKSVFTDSKISIELLSQPEVCSEVILVDSKTFVSIANELKSRNVFLPDVDQPGPMEILPEVLFARTLRTGKLSSLFL